MWNPHHRYWRCCCLWLWLRKPTQSPLGDPLLTAAEGPVALSILHKRWERRQMLLQSFMIWNFGKLTAELKAWTFCFCTGSCNHSKYTVLISVTGYFCRKLTSIYCWMCFSTLPLNRPATVEGSEGKGAWCGRCWAMDTGPQKESDTPQEAERQRKRGREKAKGKGVWGPGQRDSWEMTEIKAGQKGMLTCITLSLCLLLRVLS